MKRIIPVVVVKIKGNEPIEFYNAQIQVYGEDGEQIIYVKIDENDELNEYKNSPLGIFKQEAIDYVYVRQMLNCQEYEGDLFNEKNI